MSLFDELTQPVAGKNATPKGWTGGVELTGDAGVLTTGPVDAPVTNWDELLLIWGLDPAHFEVVEPVTFKAWDGFAKETKADGVQEIVSKRLYSYKARIQRLTVENLQLRRLAAKWEKKLLKSSPVPMYDEAYDGCTYVILVADPQLGKKRTDEAVANWRCGLGRHIERIKRMLDQEHHSIEQIVLAFQGDETEGVCNNYANQPYTVELSFSKQIELDFSLRTWSIEQVANVGLPVLVTSVYSNHGEWTRNGSKDVVTSKADNSSTCVARLVRELIQRLPNMDHVSFEIADATPDLVLDLSGTRTLFSHGHIAKGKGATTEQRTKNAIERQILGRTTELHDVTLYLVAHYHHLYCLEFEGRTLWGCPALEAEKSSEYMLDNYGVWSPPGMLGMLVGSTFGTRGWAEPAVL